MLRRLSFLVWVSLVALFAEGKNVVSVKVIDEDATGDPLLELVTMGLSNSDDCTTIRFRIISESSPLRIFKAELKNKGARYDTLEPFSMTIDSAQVAGKRVDYDFSLGFPQLFSFSANDRLIISTDRGVFEMPTTYEGALKRQMSMLQTEYESKLEVSHKESSKAWTILFIVLGAVLVVGSVTAWIVRMRFLKKKREMEEMSMLVMERTARNEELQKKVATLYGSRLDTLNMLCNEYFEKNDSPQMRASLYNEVEKQILKLRDNKSVETLQEIVNTYLDNILVKVTEQLPELNKADIKFLTYLYAGYSPRAVCIFTDIKIKNFYNRRLRLRDRILASDAPDKELFVSKM